MGDVVEGEGPAGSIMSTCSTSTGNGGWTLAFGHSQCLIVTPEGSSYSLTDDVVIVVTKEKGKNGRITHVKLGGQDVIGDEGIAHETDILPVATAVVPDKSGFTLHVHAEAVEVWRLSGHTGGERVEMIGTISIGDLVYTAQ